MNLERPRLGNWIGMANGRRFYPLDPMPHDVSIDEIAHCLSATCRFGGRCEPWYSVAQHSMHVAEMVERDYPKLAMHALLHDAAEAYIGDIVRPLKDHLCVHVPPRPNPPREDFPAAYERIHLVEGRILDAIYEAHEMRALDFIETANIRMADEVALATEARDLMGNPDWPGLHVPDPRRIDPLPPPAAKRMFLACFKRLAAQGHHLHSNAEAHRG